MWIVIGSLEGWPKEFVGGRDVAGMPRQLVCEGSFIAKKCATLAVSRCALQVT